MTLTIHRTLAPALVATVVQHLDTHVEPHLIADVSNYAKGRRRIWMPYEAPLSASRPWSGGLDDPRLWAWITAICNQHGFIPDVALVSKGGAIARHRDAAYAQYRAFGINLGVATFCYESCYPNFWWSPDVSDTAPVERYHLTGGEVFSFNVKNPHWVEDVSPHRWGINAWQVSAKERKRFGDFQAA